MLLSDAQIDEVLLAYTTPPVRGIADSVRAYIELLLRWNRRISLTTVTDPVEIVRFHFGESLFALSALEIQKSRLADVGTGAGFPGLPLALARPGLEVTLIESNAKRCAFLAEAIRVLRLSNANICQRRMESILAKDLLFDYVTARALGRFETLLSWADQHLTPGGKTLLWLGESDARLVSSRTGWNWGSPRLIPGSARRYLLAGSPRIE